MLFVAVARFLWGTLEAQARARRRALPAVEVTFFSSNIAKIEHGAWLPLAIGAGPVAGDDQLASRPGRRHPQPQSPRRGRSDEFLDSLPDAGPAPGPGARRRGLPQPEQGDHAAGAARRGRAHPHPARARADRLDRHRQRPARRRVRPVRRRGPRTAAASRSRTSRSGSATTTSSTSRSRCACAASTACSSATWTSSTPRTSSRASRSPRPARRRCGRGARSCSSRWPATPPARSMHFGLPSDRTVMIGSQIAL